MLAKIEADKAGYEEAILLDSRGYVCEGTGENLFLVKGGKVSTPGFANDILEGINRAAAIEILRDQGYEVVERDIARGELYRADEIFMTGTAAELTPIREVDDLTVGDGTPRPDHDRDPGDLRGRAARALRALRRLAGQSPRSRLPEPWTSSSTTPPCATGCRGRGCRSPSRRRCASRASSTSSACPMIEAGFPTSNPKEPELFERLRRGRADRRRRAPSA